MSDHGASGTLEIILQEVYRALREGEFSRLDDLSNRTEAAMSQLSGPLDGDSAKRLREMARRNAACLDAAARGIRAARRRLADIRDAQSGTRTYDGLGQRRLIGRTDDVLSHRA